MASHQSTPYDRVGKDDGTFHGIALSYSYRHTPVPRAARTGIGGSHRTIGGRCWRPAVSSGVNFSVLPVHRRRRLRGPPTPEIAAHLSAHPTRGPRVWQRDDPVTETTSRRAANNRGL